MILVSSCLLGNPVRYDGRAKDFTLLEKYKTHPSIRPVCPECAGQLTIPRPPAEIQNSSGEAVWQNLAQVKNKEGLDVTDNFKQGALAYEKLLQQEKVTAIILKERSPSCGVHYVYDGSFTGRVIPGKGVTTALLQKFDIPIYSEEDLTEELLIQLLHDDAV